MSIPQHIFRQYDVRGIYGKDLTEDVANLLGKAIGTKLRRSGASRLVVGRDCRGHGENLERSFIDGASSTGCDVHRVGVCPTPVGYWAIQHFGLDGGVQITGSHNPPEYNGFKITLLGRSLFGEDIQELYEIAASGDFEKGPGNVTIHEVLEPYIAELVKNLGPHHRKLKVVIDAGNGTGALTALPLYKKLGHHVIPMYCDMNPQFPNHHPDPTVEENLQDLIARVVSSKADLGIAFDGDGDRLGVVDHEGSIIWGDKLMIVFARAVLAEQPGATILGEVKCSKTMYDAIRDAGGEAVMWKTGHSLIKSKMKETDAALAGEMSGHIFFKHRYYGFDDASYAGGRLLELLSADKTSLKDRLSDVPQTFSTPEIRVDCAEETKFELVQRAIARFKERSEQDGTKVIDIDGARVEWPDGWGLVRCSNTQPLLVLRFEANTQQRLEEIRKIFDDELKTLMTSG